MSASLPEEIRTFLVRHGLVRGDETPASEPLTGGVSSDIWLVRAASGPVVVKRALARLRVAQVWEAPVERNRYERMWLEEANAIVPGVAPRILAADEGSLFAMEYLEGAPVWKAELREGRVDAAFAAEVGRRLAKIHAATAGRADVAARFATDANFHAIRLEPYLVAAGRAQPGHAAALQRLVERTAGTRVCLVHGDVSPKNILVGAAGPVLLDAECAWYGDPAFDLAFCLNHLLLKCLWVPSSIEAFLRAYEGLAGAYLEGVAWEPHAALEARVASLLPGLLLARVDGKSPAEYITSDQDRNRVRRVAGALLQSPPATLKEVKRAWQES